MFCHMTQAHSIEPGNDSEHCSGNQKPEPYRLVVRRRDRKIERCASFVPHSAVIRRADVELVIRRRKVGIEGLTAITDILPIPIVGFELIAETDFLRRDKTVRSVVDLQIPYARREGQSSILKFQV